MFKVGNIAGVVGIAVCAIAIGGRFFGDMTIFGFQAINVFMVGTFFIQLGIFAKVSGR